MVPAAVTNTYWERWLRESTVKLLRRAGVPAWERRPTPVVIDPLALGGGYGASTPEAEAACERFARWGITLETTYTAKTAAAMLRWAATTKDPKRILLWNTLSDVDLAPQVAAADPATLPAGFQPALKEAGRLK